MDAKENETLTRVGSGTPAGETLRKYWLPVGFSHETKSDFPKLVRWLGEDLILFRDEHGRVGLVEPTCPHRGTSLEYGWIEGGGLRCCYHGWVFDVGGRCLEQPGEPPGSTFKDKIRLKTYSVRELGGIVWAYMGSGEPPPLPRYDFLVREDGERTFAGYLRACNFMNQLDNCLDPVHATVLHGREVHGVRQNPERQESPEFDVIADELMASYVGRRQGPAADKEWHREVSYTPPILVVHDGGSLPGQADAFFADVAWRMPVDDYNSYSFIVKFFPFKDGKPSARKTRESRKAPPLMRGSRMQFDMTTVNGQDSAAQIGQGALADRSKEHLAHSDRGVIQVRKLWMSAIQAVMRGEDPPGIISDLKEQEMIHFDVIGSGRLVNKGEMADHVPRVVRI
jgi:5,5'-dehydrodivanillate O-demethylase oxygenase subunit